MAGLTRKVLYGIVALLLFSVIFPPLFAVFNRIEPWVLGMPFLQFWLEVVGLGIAVSLLVLWRIDEKEAE